MGKRILPNNAIATKRVISQCHRGYYVVDEILYHDDAIYNAILEEMHVISLA